MTPKYEGSSRPPCTSQVIASHDHHDDHLQQKGYEQSPSRVSTGSCSLSASSSVVTKDDEAGNISDEGAAFRWMPSKMRIMREMVGSNGINDHEVNDVNPGVPTGTIRVCSDCNTTKTPLWRSGPRGPKSLCNACGIRQRKARRAMAAAGLIPESEKTKMKKEKTIKNECTVPLKKRCKFICDPPRKKLCYEDFAVSTGNSSAFHGVFPQDEKDAAVLLMGLSYGLIRS